MAQGELQKMIQRATTWLTARFALRSIEQQTLILERLTGIENRLQTIADEITDAKELLRDCREDFESIKFALTDCQRDA